MINVTFIDSYGESLSLEDTILIEEYIRPSSFIGELAVIKWNSTRGCMIWEVLEKKPCMEYTGTFGGMIKFRKITTLKQYEETNGPL